MVTMNLVKRWHQEVFKKKIQPDKLEERIDKDVPWGTVWHHSAEHSDPRDRFVYPIHKIMIHSYILCIERLATGLIFVFQQFHDRRKIIYSRTHNLI